MKKNIVASLVLALAIASSAAFASQKSGCCDAGKGKAKCCPSACCAVKAKAAKKADKRAAHTKKAGSCCPGPCCNGGSCCAHK